MVISAGLMKMDDRGSSLEINTIAIEGVAREAFRGAVRAFRG